MKSSLLAITESGLGLRPGGNSSIKRFNLSGTNLDITVKRTWAIELVSRIYGSGAEES